jgi:hypothetical protein
VLTAGWLDRVGVHLDRACSRAGPRGDLGSGGGASVSVGDQTLRLLQERVAISRFERDLRLASAAGCPFELSAPVVEATGSRVVFVAPAAGGPAPIVVEWEMVGSTLMRRWGDCPSTRANALAGSAYRDNKTMLEGVHSGSLFSYVVDGRVMAAPSMEAELAAIESVVLDLRAKSDGARSAVRVVSEARVGR